MATETDTATAQRRPLRFATIDELLGEIDRLVAAERAGTLRRTGNWTLGQIFGHLAAWIEFAYHGYPMKVPWFIRLFLKFKVKSMLRDGMPGGVRFPNAPDGTYATEVLPAEEGAQRLRAALGRLQRGEPATCESPAFGKMSLEQRIQLALRHAELHLGYAHP